MNWRDLLQRHFSISQENVQSGIYDVSKNYSIAIFGFEYVELTNGCKKGVFDIFGWWEILHITTLNAWEAFL